MGSRRPRPRHAPAPSRALTLVLFHERPHVPLLRAVRERAVPHILALAAVLRVDAELWAGREGSLLSPAGRCRCPSQRSSPPGAPRPQSEVPLPPGTHPALTSYCCGKLRMDGRGLTDTHFLLALDITRRTRRSLVQLQDRAEAGWGGLRAEQGLRPSWGAPLPPPWRWAGGGRLMPPPGARLTSAGPWRCST